LIKENLMHSQDIKLIEEVLHKIEIRIWTGQNTQFIQFIKSLFLILWMGSSQSFQKIR
jgi:hypothetical protein